MLKKIIALCICFSAVCLSGCYDNEEIDTLAAVMAVGIENGSSEKEKIYTFAVSDTGGYKSDSSGDGASLICYTQSAADIKSAVDAIDRKISKKLSFSHVSALLFSKETAAGGMYSDMSFFEGNYKVRPQAMVALMDMSPQKYLEGLDPELEANPEKYFQSVFQRSETFVSAMRLSDFTNAFHCGNTVLAPVISGNIEGETISEEDAFITSSAVISKGKYVLEFSDNPFIGIFFSDKKVRIGDADLRSVKSPRVNVNINGDSSEVTVDLYIETEDAAVSGTLKHQAERLLKSCSEKALDIINVSYLSRKKFMFLDDYVKINWDEVLRKTNFRVRVNVVSGGKM